MISSVINPSSTLRSVRLRAVAAIFIVEGRINAIAPANRSYAACLVISEYPVEEIQLI